MSNTVRRADKPVKQQGNITGQWYLVDASNQRLGRLASQIAFLLMGKHRPDWSPHRSSEDHVVVINADKIMVTGNKLSAKHYRRHSGYPGGLKSRSLAQMLQQRPQFVLEHAVQGMLPKNRLGREFYRHLSVYAGAKHPHLGQQPLPLQGQLNSVQDLYRALSQLPPLEAKPTVVAPSVAQTAVRVPKDSTGLTKKRRATKSSISTQSSLPSGGKTAGTPATK